MKVLAKRSFNFKRYLIIAILGSLILTILSKQYEYFFFDLWITKQIQLIDYPIIDSLFKFITWLGNAYPAIFSMVTVSGAIFIYGYRKEGLTLFFSAFGAAFISEGLKLLVLRPRPDSSLINQIEYFYRSDSFPSGHVLFFVGFYGFLLYLAMTKLKKKRLRDFFTTLFLGLIVLVGVSRIYLGSHWFSDVIGAYLIGSIWLYTVVLIYHRFKVK